MKEEPLTRYQMCNITRVLSTWMFFGSLLLTGFAMIHPLIGVLFIVASVMFNLMARVALIQENHSQNETDDGTDGTIL